MVKPNLDINQVVYMWQRNTATPGGEVNRYPASAAIQSCVQMSVIAQVK